MKGTVKSYSARHGYGFIVGDHNEIFFAHKFYFRYKDPQPGDKVTFDPVEHDKGMRAKNIRREKSWETK
jgi:cold shock CspA family protein